MYVCTHTKYKTQNLKHKKECKHVSLVGRDTFMKIQKIEKGLLSDKKPKNVKQESVYKIMKPEKFRKEFAVGLARILRDHLIEWCQFFLFFLSFCFAFLLGWLCFVFFSFVFFEKKKNCEFAYFCITQT